MVNIEIVYRFFCRCRLRRFSLALIFVVALLGANAFALDESPRERLEQILHGLTSLRADFEQQVFDEYGELLETSQGEVMIAKPGRFRWAYQQPYEQLIVTDSETLWIYDADLAQVTVNPMATASAGSPAALLANDVVLSELYDIGEVRSDDSLTWVTLMPKSTNAQYAALEVGLDAGGLRALKLRDKLDQITTILFANVDRDATLPDDMFVFVPPVGVDVVRGQMP